MKTKVLFELCLGRVFPIAGFNDDGMLERRVAELLGEFAFKHSIWIELELAEVVAPSHRAKSRGARPRAFALAFGGFSPRAAARYFARARQSLVRSFASRSMTGVRRSTFLEPEPRAPRPLRPKSGRGRGNSKRRLGEILGGRGPSPIDGAAVDAFRRLSYGPGHGHGSAAEPAN
jgi:hypothetical protein